MLNNNRWETFVSVIVGVVLFSIIAVSLSNVNNAYIESISETKKLTYSSIIERNTNNILDKVLSWSTYASGSYYLNKDNSNNAFNLIPVNSSNKSYFYVDSYWENISSWSIDVFPWNVFTRLVYLNKASDNTYYYNVFVSWLTDENKSNSSWTWWSACFFDSQPWFDFCFISL